MFDGQTPISLLQHIKCPSLRNTSMLLGHYTTNNNQQQQQQKKKRKLYLTYVLVFDLKKKKPKINPLNKAGLCACMRACVCVCVLCHATMNKTLLCAVQLGRASEQMWSHRQRGLDDDKSLSTENIQAGSIIKVATMPRMTATCDRGTAPSQASETDQDVHPL